MYICLLELDFNWYKREIHLYMPAKQSKIRISITQVLSRVHMEIYNIKQLIIEWASNHTKIAQSTEVICLYSIYVYLPCKFQIHLKYKNCRLLCNWAAKNAVGIMKSFLWRNDLYLHSTEIRVVEKDLKR